jgi:predicted nucleic acid-binding Zn ribbon protein
MPAAGITALRTCMDPTISFLPMPTYVYKFIETDETIEVQQSFTDDTLTEHVHPATGAVMPVKKVFLPVGVTFKGDGFYKTDSRASSKKPKSSNGDSSSSDSKDSSSKDSSSKDSSSRDASSKDSKDSSSKDSSSSDSQSTTKSGSKAASSTSSSKSSSSSGD